ncbi:MAG: imidazoleglycerol-phosphate dehydratase, partial [Pseudomonadota bacterium]
MDSTSALSEASAGRVGRSERRTGETDIAASIGLDGTGQSSISTGIGFLDHMIDQLARHGRFDIDLTAKG